MAVYNRNFLDKVVLSINFDDVGLTALNNYKDSIKQVFDISRQQSAYEGELSVNMASGSVEQHRNELVVWQFQSTSKPNKVLTFSQKQITLEYNNYSYSDSTELLRDTREFIETFFSFFGVKIVNRIGLRYINQIQLTDTSANVEWEKYVHKSLAQPMEFAKAHNMTAARIFSQQFFKLDDCDLNFYFGIWNDDFPNQIAREIFTLDFDCFSAIPTTCDELNLTDRVKNFNTHIEKLFESSITEALRSEMNKEGVS